MKAKKPVLKVLLSNKLYIPYKAFLRLSEASRKQIMSSFRKNIFDPNLCELKQKGVVCQRMKDHLEENPGDSTSTKPCLKCSLSKRRLSCIFKKTIKDKKYVILYRGDPNAIEGVINILKSRFKVVIVDKQILNTLPEEKQFKTLWKRLEEPRRTEQKRVALQWLKEKQGVCILPPRSGKTILTSMIAAKLKQKTVVIAHQKELLEQFKKDWLFATSLKEEDIQINPTFEQAQQLPVCLYTVQQFTGKYGPAKLKKIKKLFGLVVVDEVHKSAADAYSKVLNQFQAKYRLGVTATYNRRDQRQFIVQHTLGLPSIEGGSEMLECNFRVCTSKFIMPKYQAMTGRTWNFLWSKMSNNTQRNEYLTALALRDVSKGHKIIIPVRYIKHVTVLSDMIRKALKRKGIRNVSVKEYAGPFLKNPKYREEVSQNVRDGKYDVVVAVASMISLGFNAPKMSAIYINAGGYMFDIANLYQQYSRVRTPCEGKQKPLIRIIKDNGVISEKSTNIIVKEMKSKNFTELKPSGVAKGKKGWAQ